MSTANPDWKLATDPTGLIPDLPVTDKAREMLRLVELFPMTQGAAAGKRFGECILPWQQKLVLAMFAAGVREVGVKAGKGSGKTVLLAAYCLAMVMYYSERKGYDRAVIMLISADVDAARIAWSHILEAIRSEPYLDDLFHVHLANRELKHKGSGIVLKIGVPRLGAASGRRILGLALDEIHVAALENKDFSQVIDQLKRGAGNFGDDFTMLGITTAPPGRADGYYTEWLRRMRAVRDGKLVDNSVLPVLFEMPHDDPEIDPGNPDEWWRGMPSLVTPDNLLGTMDVKHLERELEEAAREEEISGGLGLQRALSQRLGIEPDDRAGGETALSEFWAEGAIGEVRLDPNDLRLAIGYDPSSGLADPFAVCKVFKSGSMYYVESRQFLTRNAYSKSPERIRMVYDAAIKRKELTLHETAEAVEMAVFEWTHAINPNGELWPEYGGDAAGLAGFTERFSNEIGEYVAIKQGWTLLAAYERTSALLQSGRLKHLDQPLLNENVRNLVVKGMRFEKMDATSGGKGFSKIDGCMAMMSAIQMLEQSGGISPRDFFPGSVDPNATSTENWGGPKMVNIMGGSFAVPE